LQYAMTAQEGGTPLLPIDLSGFRTDELLSLVDSGLRAQDREDILRATQAALVAARRLNPYNTDHTANLARLSRAWAFINALGPNDIPDDTKLRELVSAGSKDVDYARLDDALTYFEQATALSPQNAGLWNELASVQFIRGDTAGALKTLDRSLALDPSFGQTYLLRGDIAAAGGDKAGALEAYRQAARLSPKDTSLLSAVGVLSAQLGDANAALDAFRQIINLESAALASAEGQLAHATDATRAAPERAVANYRSQLQLSYRNMALVLRDAGRTDEAISAAEQALSFAAESERPTIEALIAELRGRPGG
jgi:tetratricopeptide (TPR) repeat protein